MMPNNEKKAKARDYYAKNRDKVLDYQRSPEYVENRREHRRNSESYKAYQRIYQPDYQEEYQKIPGNKEKHLEAVAKYEANNRDKVDSYRKEYRKKHRKDHAEYMREWRAKKKAENSSKRGDSASE